MYIADLHIHSRYSRATSRDCDLPHLDWWARKKGIAVTGTGDFTHPAWRAEMREQLAPAEDGLYTLREELRLAGSGEPTRFLVTGEISCIYKRDGKTRKVHHLILLPSLEAADEVSARLEAVGNIRSDGRPILGLDSRDLLELTLEACPDAELIPAHIWTPHFSLFGAFSGFDTMEECFGSLAGQIHAVETGLSSDPPMNWRLSALDRLTLVSHSDAHSPGKLGREADLLDTGLSYPELVRAIRTGDGFCGTVEFFPEEGKYHLDGHRNCGVCLTPVETQARDGICPVCGKKLTIGVEHRVEVLADRPEGFRPENAKPFQSLAPLPEVIAASTGLSAAGKRTAALYEKMLEEMGPEFRILREASIPDIERIAGPCVAEGVRRLRLGQVERRPGFDGQYGIISLLAPAEIERFGGQLSLFGLEVPGKKPVRKRTLKKSAPVPAEVPAAAPARLNPEQEAAVTAAEPCTAVAAGPGTGKTKTLVSRIAYLIEEKGVKAGEITAVTFTNQAAAEMRQRLEARLGGKRAVSRMRIGTFHAICLGLLGDVALLGRSEALRLAAEVLPDGSGEKLLQAVSKVKNGLSLEEAGLEEELYTAYCDRVQALGLLDFDDLLAKALEVDTAGQAGFSHLLVDEFQDINDMQYALVQSWSRNGKSLFVIGDPDQSIYGFRGASGQCFRRLTADRPDTRVIRLAENYRSTPEVLRAALPVIEKNPGGPRTLVPQRPSGPAVRLVRAPDDFSEAVFISKEIIRMTGGVDMLQAQDMGRDRETRAFSDIAVLCRTNRQLRLLENCLRHDGIPCVVSGRDGCLEAEEVRGFLAFFRTLAKPEDTAALAETVRQFGPPDVWQKRAEEWRLSAAKEKPWKLAEQWEAKYGRTDALDRLRNMAVFHSTFEEFWNVLAAGEEGDLRRASGKRWESGAVRLMTLHAAKGLEFPAVFVAGVNSGTLPLETQSRPADGEEERRLLFVGMTRAREELILTTGGEPSPFLVDLPGGVVRETLKQRERPAQQFSLF